MAMARTLDAEFLLGSEPLEAPVSTDQYSAPKDALPGQPFHGTLELLPSAGSGRISILTDWFDYEQMSERAIADLPPFRYEFVLDGSDLVPALRGPQRGSHPHWEFILEPGAAWSTEIDGWSRAVLPFSLQERNANCTHNGLMTFLYTSDGRVSRVAYQVGSETCQYFQADLWGVLPARYLPGKVPEADRIIAAHRLEKSRRLPIRPLEAISELAPGIRAEQFITMPGSEVSVAGFIINGIHYRSHCGTRYGPYPFCDVLDLPSYSLAKSISAALAWMILEQETPGIGQAEVGHYIPQCNDERWDGVTLEHLLDMATGNFNSPEPNVDEYASYETAFMEGDTHAQKVAVACTLFSRSAEPGTVFAYHTSDTYLAGTLMSAALLQQAGGSNNAPFDLHRDLLYEKLYRPLGLSPILRETRRTYDEVAQPFSGYGLTLHSDDIARLGAFLVEGSGKVDETPVLDFRLLNEALQRIPEDTGLPAGSADLRYNNGYWAFRTDLDGACREPVWIPFMSGYGGISVALLPNRSVYYVFSDHGQFKWLPAAVESNKIKSICEK